MVIGLANQCDKAWQLYLLRYQVVILQGQLWFRLIYITILQITFRPSKCHIWYISQLCVTIVAIQKFISMFTTHCIFRGEDDKVKAGRFNYYKNSARPCI